MALLVSAGPSCLCWGVVWVGSVKGGRGAARGGGAGREKRSLQSSSTAFFKFKFVVGALYWTGLGNPKTKAHLALAPAAAWPLLLWVYVWKG